MPLLFRCLRHFRRGMQGTWPGSNIAASTANGSAAARMARRSASSASAASEGPRPENAQQGNLSLVAAAALLGGVLAWSYSTRRSGLPQRYVTPEEAGAGGDLAREASGVAVPSIGSFQAIDEHGKVVTDETLLDQGDFLLLLIDPSERPDVDEAPLKEFAQINDAIAMESLMAWRLVRPVIMAPNVRPDANGIEVIKQAVEMYRETLKSAFRRRSKHAIHGLIGGDTAKVAERAKAYAASANGPAFAADADRRPTLYVVDPKGAFKHAWMLQARPIEVWKVSALVEEIIEYNL